MSNDDNTSDISKKTSGLDLGLEKLLTELKGYSATGEGDGPGTKGSAEAQSSAESVEKWQEIVSNCEQTLANQSLKSASPELWIESQAWWILGQLKLKNLPIGVLSGPLESLLDFYVSQPDTAHQVLVAELCTKCVDALLEEKQFAQAVHFLNRIKSAGLKDVDLKAGLITVAKNFSALSSAEQSFVRFLPKNFL